MAEVRADCGHPAGDRRGGEPVGAHRRDPALDVARVGVCRRPVAEGGERREVAPVGVHRARRATRGEREEEALDVGIRGVHGVPRDSAVVPRLLSPGTVGSLRPRAVVTLLALAALAAAAAPAPAEASQLIARNTSTERLAVSRDGKALVTYHSRGQLRRVLAWGAVNALPPSPSRPQVAFTLDYSGGWGSVGKPVWKTFRNVCGPYRGPQLPYLVAACTAPDGSHWALQRWRRSQANYGLPPWKKGHGDLELRLSHWTGPVAVLEAWTDWYYNGRWHHLFGRLTYRGRPVHGFATTPNGEPLDSYGRVLYLDVLDSALGPGWRRENGFVARRPTGAFCYGFVPHTAPTGERRPAANGRRYRLSVSGPGVTPDVVWEGEGVPDFDPEDPAHREHEERMTALQRELFGGHPGCRP